MPVRNLHGVFLGPISKNAVNEGTTPASAWPPPMDDIGFENRYSVVCSNPTTVTELTSFLDGLETSYGGGYGTANNPLWGFRLGFDWSAHEPSDGNFNRGTGNDKNCYDYIVSRGYNIHASLAYTARWHQRQFTFVGKANAGNTVTVTNWNGTGSASVPSGDWGGTPADNSDGLVLAGPGVPADCEIISLSGSTFTMNGTTTSAAAGSSYTIGRNANSPYNAKMETDDPQSYGDYVAWVLGTNGFPAVKTLNGFNEAQHHIGARPWVDIPLQAKRNAYGYFACKDTNPDVYWGLGSTAFTTQNDGKYYNAFAWYDAMIQWYINDEKAGGTHFWSTLRSQLSSGTQAITSSTFPFDYVMCHPYQFGRRGASSSWTTGADNYDYADTDVGTNYNGFIEGPIDVYNGVKANSQLLNNIYIMGDECGLTWDTSFTNNGNEVRGTPDEAYIHTYKELELGLHPDMWPVINGKSWPGGVNRMKQIFFHCVRGPSTQGGSDDYGVYAQPSASLKAKSGTSRGAPLNTGKYSATYAASATSHSGGSLIDFGAAFPTDQVRLHKLISGINIPANSYVGKINSTTQIELSSSRFTHIPRNVTTGTTGTCTVTNMDAGNDMFEALKNAKTA